MGKITGVCVGDGGNGGCGMKLEMGARACLDEDKKGRNKNFIIGIYVCENI